VSRAKFKGKPLTEFKEQIPDALYTQMDDLVAHLEAGMCVGQKVEVTFVHEWREQKATIPLTERPSEQ
jgi:hypothetical protein